MRRLESVVRIGKNRNWWLSNAEPNSNIEKYNFKSTKYWRLNRRVIQCLKIQTDRKNHTNIEAVVNLLVNLLLELLKCCLSKWIQQTHLIYNDFYIIVEIIKYLNLWLEDFIFGVYFGFILECRMLVCFCSGRFFSISFWLGYGIPMHEWCRFCRNSEFQFISSILQS